MALRNGFAAAAFVALLATCLPLLAAEGRPAPVSKAQLSALVADLGHEDFARREAATRKLSQLGTDAVDSLVAASESQNAEVSWRALATLEQLGAKCGEATLNRLVTALNRVQVPERSELGALRSTLQARQVQFRHTRALAKIRALGADAPAASAGLSEAPVAIALEAAIVPDPVEPSPVEIAEEDLAPISAGPDDLKLTPLAATPRIAEPIAEPPPAPEGEADASEVSSNLAVSESATPVKDELVDVADEPAPPPDVLPVDPPGEMPVVEGEIADAYVSEDPPVDVDVAVPVDPKLSVGGEYVNQLTLTAAWSGGDHGLALLKDLPELQHLSLNHAEVSDAGLEHLSALPNLSFLEVRGTQITSQGLRRLRIQKPSLLITAIGDAKLGVSAQSDGDRCQLVAVNPQSGAAKAGLQAGDFVTQVDGAKVTSFVDLMIAVFNRKAGDKLSVQYERGGEAKTALVELQARAEATVMR